MARQQQEAPTLWDVIVGRTPKTPKTPAPKRYVRERTSVRDLVATRGRTTTVATAHGGSQARRTRQAMEDQARSDPAFIRGARKSAKAPPRPAAKRGSRSWLGPAFTGSSNPGKPQSGGQGGHSWLGPAFKR